MSHNECKIAAVVPAAGVGKRMQSDCPKQYLPLLGEAIIVHTVNVLLANPAISKVIIAISPEDEYFSDTKLVENERVAVVSGGKERVHSVLNGIELIDSKTVPWVLVHDAARPCLTQEDLNTLIDQCLRANQGGILAAPVRDTMKRGFQGDKVSQIKETVDREELWHALTPQLFPTLDLKNAIKTALENDFLVTDEASAMEFVGLPVQLISARADNIKVTQPADLAMAEFILRQIKESSCE